MSNMTSKENSERRVRETVRVSSPHQFEFKQRFTFSKHHSKVRYTVETFLFLPPALQVNKDNFSSVQLLRTMKNYIRLRAPKIPLSRFFEATGPLAQLDSVMQHLDDSPQKAAPAFEDAIRRFALVFRQAVKTELTEIIHAPEDTSATRIAVIIGQITKILDAFREKKETYQALESRWNGHAFSYCDEFMSIVCAYYLRSLYYALPASKRTPVIALREREQQHRISHYPDCVAGLGRTNEDVLFRWSVLKKYINSYLFLEAQTLGGQPMLLHSLYGFAAALSMLFATTVAFSWQGAYGTLSMNLFWAMVISYIFKDRIKEGLRAWLFKRFQKWIPDRRLHLLRNNTDNTGSVHESFRFTTRKQLPASIASLRNSAHTVNFLSQRLPEDILIHKKEVTLENLDRIVADTSNSIMDITRFTIKDFLKYADNLFEELPALEDEDLSDLAKMPVGEKLYHIYVGRRVTFADRVSCDMVRLIINGQGIKRMEIVSPLTLETKKA